MVGLSKNDRDADKEIADVINEIESLQFEEFNEGNDKKMRILIDEFNSFSIQYSRGILVHADEIKNYIDGMRKWYQMAGKQVPEVKFEYNKVN